MSPATKKIELHHVTRVEGHGNIYVDIENGAVKRCQWAVVEAPRFFEAMAIGRKWDELNFLTSRICGICSIGHQLASLKATESAMAVKPSEQTVLLRKLLLLGENLQSHILHVGYLVLPDLAGVGSVIPLTKSNPAAVGVVVRLHRLANELCDIVGGRTTHPVRAVVNGFTMLPRPRELVDLRKRLEASIDDLQALVNVLKSVAGNLPAFERDTEYVALVSNSEYALYDGLVGSTDAKPVAVEDYLKVTNEYIVPQSTAKYAKYHRASYAVGALARYKLNHAKLSDPARKVASELGLTPDARSPFMNNIAQVVETVDSVVEAMNIIDLLLMGGLKEEPSALKVKAGRGVAAVEVPRGILFHDYTYDENGICVMANCIIPTNQNHANIQLDMEKLVDEIKEEPREAIELKLEMLVRSYDPCISCSTHMVKVRWL